MPIKFSVVMPCFNAEKYIQDAIDSVVNQTYENFELIVVDGGSTDGTLDILRANQEHISVLVSEPDQGQSDAFNKGFALASGDFYIWLNSDDLLMPRLLEHSARYLDANGGCKWLAFNTVFLNKVGVIHHFHHAPPWNDFLNINHRPQVECPTSIFHRDLLQEAGGFDLRLHYTMDLDLWRTFVRNGHKWSRLDYYGYLFRIHDDSKTNKETVPVVPSPEEVKQGEIMSEKHNIRTRKLLVLLSKILKVFYCFPYSFVSGLRWRGVHISEYMNGR